MMSAIHPRQPDDAKLKGWHVLLIMLAFFGVMFAVNGVFLYSAITSFPGEDVEKSYAQGLDYNSAIAARKAQENLGWTVRAGLAGSDETSVAVEIETADGDRVRGLDVTAVLRRPATNEGDIALLLIRDRASGRYAAELPHSLQSGQWDMIIKAVRPSDGAEVEARKAIHIK